MKEMMQYITGFLRRRTANILSTKKNSMKSIFRFIAIAFVNLFFTLIIKSEITMLKTTSGNHGSVVCFEKTNYHSRNLLKKDTILNVNKTKSYSYQ